MAQSTISALKAASSEIPLAVTGAFAGLPISDTIADRQAYASLGGTSGSTITKDQMNSLRSIRMKEVAFVTIPLIALFPAIIGSAPQQ